MCSRSAHQQATHLPEGCAYRHSAALVVKQHHTLALNLLNMEMQAFAHYLAWRLSQGLYPK